jgi:thiol-disulfide isomerase/thioredoxin
MEQIDIVDEKSAEKFDGLAKNKYAIVKYYATWCGFCTEIEPIWNNVVKHFITNKDNTFLFATANEVGAPFMKSHNSVDGYPTILYLINGKKEDTYSGSRDTEGMIEWVQSKLNAAKKITGGGKKKYMRKKSMRKKSIRKKSIRNKSMRKNSLKRS